MCEGFGDDVLDSLLGVTTIVPTILNSSAFLGGGDRSFMFMCIVTGTVGDLAGASSRSVSVKAPSFTEEARLLRCLSGLDGMVGNEVTDDVGVALGDPSNE